MSPTDRFGNYRFGIQLVPVLDNSVSTYVTNKNNTVSTRIRVPKNNTYLAHFNPTTRGTRPEVVTVVAATLLTTERHSHE